MSSIFVRAGAMAPAFFAMAALAQTTSVTYQGELKDGGTLANGVYDFRFTPYSNTGGTSAIGPALCADDVQVVAGRFSVLLPITVPSGTDLYLEIDVRVNTGLGCGSSANYTPIAPRQLVTPAPAAIYAAAVREKAPTIPGAMRFLPATKQLQVFDGEVWNVVVTGSASTAAPYDYFELFETAGTHTFVVPAGVTSLLCIAAGGGGGGGGISPGTTTLPTVCSVGTGSYAAGGGSGANGAVIAARVTVTPGETLTINIGNGGAAGTSAAGGAGQQTRLRRASTTDIVVAPGGGGGGRRSSAVTMGNGAGVVCNGNAGGGAGISGGAPQLLGAGTLLFEAASDAGQAGEGPACTDASPDVFCPAQGGDATSANFVLPDTLPGTTGFSGASGGQGADGNSSADAGGNGKLILYWN